MIINDRVGKYLLSNRAWYNRNVNTITKLAVHHDAIPHSTKTADEVMASIMHTHTVKKGWPGASYHYYIHKDGQVYQMNKHEWVTWHDGHNWDSIGIVVTGYFHSTVNDEPTEAQLISLKALLDRLTTQHPEFPAGKADVYGHRERSSTACPGDLFFPKVLEYRNKLGEVTWGGIIEDEDMPITDQTKIPIGGEWGELEVQRIRSLLSDQKRDLSNLAETNKILTKKVGVLEDSISTLEQDRANLEAKVAEQEETIAVLKDSINTQTPPQSNSLSRFFYSLYKVFEK